ncbi:MAG: GTP-binding protein [Gammaproteobacteria bacterium]
MRRMFERRTYRQLKEAHEHAKPIIKTNQKIAVFGPISSGKTRLASALTGDPIAKTEKTIGTLYFKGRSTETVNLDFWDISGDAKYESLWPLYLRGSNQVILTFDSANSKSFNQVETYYAKIKKYAPDAKIILIGMNSKPDKAPKISEEKIKEFIKEHPISSYQLIDAGTKVNNSDDLHNLLIKNAEPQIEEESTSVLEAKQFAKDSIDILREAADSNGKYSETILSICKILEGALTSENMNEYMAYNHELLKEKIGDLRYAPSSLYSTACNTIMSVLVCCAILSTAFIAFYWLDPILKENYAQKGDYFLFSSGKMQKAQEALHKTNAVRYKQG